MSHSVDCADFYRQRDQRSVEYVRRSIDNLLPVHVAIDRPSSLGAPGQLALLALVNQLARVSRRISFSLAVPEAAVLVRTPFAGDTLREALLATAHDIDPCGDFVISSRPSYPTIAIGLGADVGGNLDWYLGANRAVAYLQREPVAFGEAAATLRGAALSSCLGAAAVFRQQLGLPVASRILSAWTLAEGDNAALGPDSLERTDVGRVLMIGAGAVGASLAYWLNAFGVDGRDWTVVDGDAVELHNTNRGLVFIPCHAGWPTGSPLKKAKVVAPLISGSTPCDTWYHECEGLRGQTFDVVLALANDYDVRQRLTQLNVAISLQATTGENWLSQLHRHILGRDGCIWCRTGEIRPPRFGCSTTNLELPDGSRSDAALPFLSAASGLMLATALQRLAIGELGQEAANCWSWDFGSEYRMTARPAARPCRDGCSFPPSETVRRRLVRGTRWESLVT